MNAKILQAASSSNSSNDFPLVSIIIPCRNEERLIAKCLDSIIANDYPKDKLEILIIDGMSEDRTRKILENYEKGYAFVRCLDNPKKITPAALNIGIKDAEGEIIMRMDAHATYDRTYISKCVKYLNEYDSDDVGGIWKILPRDATFAGEAIVAALCCPFGVGNAYYRLPSNELRHVDTVPFFCCKKEVFKKIGLFNEKLARSQDMEFNFRMRLSGYKILLVPEILSYYYVRSDIKSFLKNNLVNGFWAIYAIKFSTYILVSLRHIVPLAFILGLICSAFLAFFCGGFIWLSVPILGLYALGSLYFSAKISLTKRDLRYLFIMPLIFLMLHMGYGLGSLWGVVKLLWPQWSLRNKGTDEMDEVRRKDFVVHSGVEDFPFVSVIISCFNEENFIGKCLDSILSSNYPNERLEVLVVDGMSNDRTKNIVRDYVDKFPFIKLLENPRRIIPAAMNIGIRNAKYEIIMKIDAHTIYERDYIPKCVKFLDEYNVDNVGGRSIAVPRNNTALGKAIVLSLSHWFGVGASRHRLHPGKPVVADTAYSGCYKKGVFYKMGVYDENIGRSEDIALNSKIRKAGGKILLVPEIKSYYYARSDMVSFIKHNFDNGFWVTYPLKFRRIIFSLQHVVPLFFVAGIISSIILSLFYPVFRWVWLFSFICYILIALYFSGRIALEEKNLRYLVFMPFVFGILHLAYGLGSLWGLIKLVWPKSFSKETLVARRLKKTGRQG